MSEETLQVLRRIAEGIRARSLAAKYYCTCLISIVQATF
jgi:hypothetical protein